MFESKRRDRLYATDPSELASDKQLWKINQLTMQINNTIVRIKEQGGKSYMSVYCDTMRINLPITKQEAWKAIDALKQDLDYKQRVLERCKADA